MHAFLQNAISFAVLYEPISKLYRTKIQPYIFPMLGLHFLHDTGFEKPDYTSGTITVTDLFLSIHVFI